jgi:hypothetical protein
MQKRSGKTVRYMYEWTKVLELCWHYEFIVTSTSFQYNCLYITQNQAYYFCFLDYKCEDYDDDQFCQKSRNRGQDLSIPGKHPVHTIYMTRSGGAPRVVYMTGRTAFTSIGAPYAHTRAEACLTGLTR